MENCLESRIVVLTDGHKLSCVYMYVCVGASAVCKDFVKGVSGCL